MSRFSLLLDIASKLPKTLRNIYRERRGPTNCPQPSKWDPRRVQQKISLLSDGQLEEAVSGGLVIDFRLNRCGTAVPAAGKMDETSVR